MTSPGKSALPAAGRTTWKLRSSFNQDLRGRKQQGENHPKAILTDDDVRLIKALLMEKWRLQEQVKALNHTALAEKFGVSTRTIQSIAQNLTWLHIPWDPRS